MAHRTLTGVAPAVSHANSLLAAVKGKRAILGTLAMVLPPSEVRSREQS
jgi:hypothetical protein